MKYTSSAISSCTLAKELEDKSDFEGAWGIISEWLDGVETLPLKEQAHVLLQAGTIASRTGRVERHVLKGWASHSLDLFERLGDKSGATSARYGLALICRNAGSFKEAHNWLDLAKEKAAEDTEALCKIAALRALVNREEGKIREALDVLLEVSPLYEVLDNHNLKAKYYGELAVVRRQVATAHNTPEQYDLALIDYTAASYHHEEARDYRSAAIVKNNRAFLLYKLGRFEEARDDVSDAIEIYIDLKDRPNLAQARETKAQILLALDRAEEAEAEARLSCEALRIGGERALFVESSITHGRCLARLNQKARAFQAFQLAQDVAEFIEFNHGLGMVSLAILEEMNDLDVDTRRLHHQVVKKHLSLASDIELAGRHAACIRVTTDLLKTEMGLDEAKESVFSNGFSLDEAVLAFERLCIEQAMEEAGGCQKVAAQLLGISASNLNFKLKNHHKPAKRLQTYGHYRGVKRTGCMDTKPMPNDALSDLGVREGDELVLKKGCQVDFGDVVLLRSRRKVYVGIYGQEQGEPVLYPANSEYETLWFEEGKFEIVSKVVGYIPRGEVGTTRAKVRPIPSAPSEARLPAS